MRRIAGVTARPREHHPVVVAPRGSGRGVGAILIVLGAIAILEGRQLYALREALVAGAIVGDDTMLVAAGIALVLIGVFLFFARLPPVTAAMPQGPIRTQMIVAAAALAAYWFLVPWLGYTASTGLVAVTLFRTMGRYGWTTAVLLAAVVTGALYLMFRVWLLQPLPSGVLGI